MNITIDVPVYDPANGFQYKWEDNFRISTSVNEGAIQISANKEGLISLARHLLCLAQIENGYHLHLDADNSLEEGSVELILVKEVE